MPHPAGGCCAGGEDAQGAVGAGGPGIVFRRLVRARDLPPAGAVSHFSNACCCSTGMSVSTGRNFSYCYPRVVALSQFCDAAHSQEPARSCPAQCETCSPVCMAGHCQYLVSDHASTSLAARAGPVGDHAAQPEAGRAVLDQHDLRAGRHHGVHASSRRFPLPACAVVRVIVAAADSTVRMLKCVLVLRPCSVKCTLAVYMRWSGAPPMSVLLEHTQEVQPTCRCTCSLTASCSNMGHDVL